MPQVEQVSKEQWVSWKQDPVTRFLVHSLVKRRNELVEDWAEGRLTSIEEEHRQQGRVQNLQDIVLYLIQDFDYIKEEKNDGQSGSA